MPRRQNRRELEYGRLGEWKRKMSKRVTLPGGVILDMDDADAIRQHALKVIAEISVQETGFHQTRLAAANRLLELADSMKPAGAQAAPSSIDDLAAARERLRQARLAERQGK